MLWVLWGALDHTKNWSHFSTKICLVAPECTAIYNVTVSFEQLLRHVLINLIRLLLQKPVDDTTAANISGNSKASDWPKCYVTALLIGLFCRCRSLMTKQQVFWLVCHSIKPFHWPDCYVTALLIGYCYRCRSLMTKQQVFWSVSHCSKPSLIGLTVM